MNNILKLKGTFTQKSHPNTFGPPSLPKQTVVRIEKIEKFMLPDTDIGRALVQIDKVKNTPGKYPRKAGVPAKEPL